MHAYDVQVLGLTSRLPLLARSQVVCQAAMSTGDTCITVKKELRKETRRKLKELSQDDKVQQSMPGSTTCQCRQAQHCLPDEAQACRSSHPEKGAQQPGVPAEP